ncbi:hypothetical protein BX616_007274 [Lobosporangium transversale]|nr:hypothetical protein BX616_007274 [Lobosporangium transversale]
MGAAWHKACFTCRECNRRLDSSTLAEHEGEAYCKTCHKKKWGPTGYGYAAGVLVPEDPENLFKQSIGRPMNSSGSISDSNSTGELARNNTGGSSNGAFGGSSPQLTQSRLAQHQYQQQHQPYEETEEQRLERLTPVNATLKKKSSLDMIREQAEASRKAYDEAHAQRIAQRYGQVNVNLTGGSNASTGSRGERGGYNNNSGYLSGSDTSSAFGSTIATTSSPAPSLSSISSVASSQPITKPLFLNQNIRSSSTSSVSNQQDYQDAESEFARNRQALSFQTGAPLSSSSPNVSSGPPSLPKRNHAPANSEPSPQPASEVDESYLEYAPFRIVARNGDSKAPEPTVEDDEWETEAANKKSEPAQPMYLSQYLKQQQQQQRQQQRFPEQEQENQVHHSTPPTSVSSASARSNTLTNESDRLNLREQEQRQHQQIPSAVSVDEWDEEPTPNVPSKPQNLSYSPAHHASPAATRTWTPTANTSSASLNNTTSNSQTRIALTEALTPKKSSANSGTFSTTAPKTSYYRTGTIMTPKRQTVFGGGGDICPRCQKTVYHAESALAPGGAKYHKLCLRCVECSKSLDSTNMTDRQGVPYCKTCYSKAFGAKGYGYGSGASMLHTEL